MINNFSKLCYGLLVSLLLVSSPILSYACGEVELSNYGNYYTMLTGSTKQWRYVKNSGTCGGPCEIVCDVQMGTCFSGSETANIPGVTDLGATYTMYNDSEALRFYDDGNLINVGQVYINDINDFGECEPEPEPEPEGNATSTAEDMIVFNSLLTSQILIFFVVVSFFFIVMMKLL